MNLFWLHHDPSIAAQFNSDQHIISSIKDGSIILQVALYRNGAPEDKFPYDVDNPYNSNDALISWAGENLSNWQKCYDMVRFLNYEYKLRNRKESPDRKAHKSWKDVKEFSDCANKYLDDGKETPIPQENIPEQYREENRWKYGKAYRTYYKNEKATFKNGPAWWSHPRTIPEFMQDAIR